MNSYLRRWLANTLLSALDRPSCIVMDNASYHNVVAHADKIPTSSSTKQDVMAWLAKENISFCCNNFKTELLQLVRQTKKSKIFIIDKVIAEHGHTSLRLPPYHSHLNPIELVWAAVKGQVAAVNKTFKLRDVKVLTRDALAKIDIEYWNKCEEHVLREEEAY
uniref:Tc1-like transposase DDE domain-containing protein n=1 Tax=Arion vulgaris TaxID=1028688 RepID=A0A0B7BNV4_9EUPU